jgi:hypothetical protein
LRRGRVALEPHHAARRLHRHDARDAELGRLLHHEVHALAAGDALHQRDRERRFRTRGREARDLDLDAAAPQLQHAPRVVVAVAVEERHRVAGAQPQDAPDVVGGAAGERRHAAGRQALSV